MISNYSYCIPFLASDEGEGDATEARLAAKTKQLASYDEPDEDDAEMADAGRSLEAEEAELEAAAKAAGDEDEEQDNMDEDNSENTKHLDRKAVKESKYVVRWEFDEENGAWCEMDMKVYIYISVYAKYLLPCLLKYFNLLHSSPLIQRRFLWSVSLKRSVRRSLCMKSRASSDASNIRTLPRTILR